LGGPNKKTTGAVLVVVDLLLNARWAAMGDAVKAVVPERITQHSRIASSEEEMMIRSILLLTGVLWLIRR
jgi:hypothetical protein